MRMAITDDFFPPRSIQERFISHLWSCLILVSVSVLITNAEPVQQNVTSINYSLYHHSDALLQEIHELALRNPHLMLVHSSKLDVDGYTSEVMVVTIEHKNTDIASDEKYRVLLSFGQHGRELITSEVALRLLSALVGEWDSTILDNDTIKKQLKKLIIKIVPMENYNGRRIVESGQFCERKNGRGVDINRNWSVDWGKKEQDFDPTEEFPGMAPFSEPETRIMRDIAKMFKPHLWINVHSGMQAMFMPYDYKSVLPDERVAEPMKKLLHKLDRLHCNSSCVVGPGGGSVGYLAHGTATDYMYEVLAVPLAFTFEIYGDPEAPNDDCFRMFNPTDPASFEAIVTNWYMAFITVFMELENVLHSLPMFEFAWTRARKELSQLKKFVPFGTNRQIDDGKQGKQDWIRETWALLELIVLLSIVYVFFIWYVYLKGLNRSLFSRLFERLPSSFHEHL